MANYFQPHNLTALREMALLWVADQVEVALQRYRTDQRVTDVWETRERVVVALTGGPESETVLRRAARIAKRSGSAELFAVHVLRGDGLAGAPVGALAGLRRLAEDVGASFHTVVGDDVPAALLDFARGVDATQLVLGTSRRSRLARSVVEGIGARVVQDSGHIDVHMVTHAEAGRGLRLPRLSSAVPLRRRALGWALAVALPLLATAIGTLGRELVGLSTDVVLFFLATVVVALVGGLGPALLAAFGGALLLNFFLTPPLYTFTIAERENVITLVAMVLVAVLVALVVDRAARRAQQAAAARAEAALLASFSRTVLTGPQPLPRLLDRVREAFGLTTVAVLQRRDGQWQTSACSGPPDCTRPEQADVDVAVEPDIHLVGQGRALPAADRRLLDAVAGQALLALRNQQIAAEAAEARRRADATELRTALLSAVGHDLRTPLASIKAAAGGLRDPQLPLSDADRLELAATIDESTDRLTRVVNNLLDSSRLATGALLPALRPVGYDEIAALALRGLDPGLDPDRVRMEIDERLPEVLADPGLLERVVANLVDNALRHGAGAPVALRASSHAEHVELRVVDEGPGVPAGRSRPPVHPVPAPRRPHPRRARARAERGPRADRGHGRHTHRRGHPGRRAHRGDQPAGRGPAGRADRMTRVLVVDDDLALLRALRINLAARGYDVVTAADGRTGLRAAAERRPRRHRARPRPARPRRRRRDHRAARVHRHPDHRAVRPHRLSGQGAGPGPRRRRLRDQALRRRRADGPAARGRPAGRRDHRRRVRSTPGELHHRPRPPGSSSGKVRPCT